MLDPESLETKLYQDYYGLVYHTALRRMGNPQDAEDACHDAFLRAYRALAKIKGELHPGGWLYRIVSNHCSSLLRRQAVFKWYPLEPTVPRDGQTNHFEVLTSERTELLPEPTLLRDEQRRQVHQALVGLNPNHRTALIMRNGGMSCQEIGEEIGKSSKATKSLLYRARNNFREAYLKLEAEAT